jgi:hypothetical protein
MTELFLQLTEAPKGLEPGRLAGLAGLVVDGDCLTPQQCRPLAVPVVALTGASAELLEWRSEVTPVRVVELGLEECARRRDERPELEWLPRLVICRRQVVYRMAEYHGEGFKFYAPDPSTLRGYCVSVGGLALERALERARELGLQRVWVHAKHAAESGDGLDLELLARARRNFEGALWVSGGVTKVQHLKNLGRQGGAAAVVIHKALLAQEGAEVLAAAVAPPQPPEAPIHFSLPRKHDTGVV